MAVNTAYYVKFLIGKRGGGKTTYCVGNEALLVPSAIQRHMQAHNMKCIIADTQADREGYEDIELVDFRKWTNWRGAVRTIVNPDTQEAFFKHAAEHYRDCLVVLEDCSKYLPTDFLKTPAQAFFVDTKNIRCAVWGMVQDYMMIPVRAFPCIDELIIFKNSAHPSSRGRQVIPLYDEVLAAHNRVQKHKAKYYKESVIIGG